MLLCTSTPLQIPSRELPAQYIFDVYPTKNIEKMYCYHFYSQIIINDAHRCHELAFFTFFSPYFSQHLRTLSFRFDLIILTTLVLTHFACSLSSQIKRVYWTHDVADTTFILQRAARFKTRQKPSSIVWGLSPRQDHRRRHPLQDRRVSPIAQ